MRTKRFMWPCVVLGMLAANASAARGDALYGWGYIGDGTIESSPAPVPLASFSSGVSGIATGGDSDYIVKDGAAYGWGRNYSNGPAAISSLSSNVTSIAAGLMNVLAVKDGVLCELAYGSTLVTFPSFTSVSKIAAGDAHQLVVQNGAAYSWGYNGLGQLGDGTTTNRDAPVPVTGLTSNVTAVSAGHFHSLAVKGGQAYAWGDNSWGQLGDGTLTQHNSPTLVGSLSNVTAVAAGFTHSMALADGKVYTWGSNGIGQLGDGTTTDHWTPELVAGLSHIVSIAAGQQNGYALDADGSVWAWGTGGYVGDGTSEQRLSPVHVLAPVGYRISSIDADPAGTTVLATVVAIPEGSSLVMLGAGAAMLLGRRKRAGG